MTVIQKLSRRAELEKIKADSIAMLQKAIDAIDARGAINCVIDIEYPERRKPFFSWECPWHYEYESTGEEIMQFTITMPAKKES